MLPPRHRLTHTPRHVSSRDSAWDHVRITREIGLARLKSDRAHERLLAMAEQLDALESNREPGEDGPAIKLDDVAGDDRETLLVAALWAYPQRDEEEVHELTAADLRAMAATVEASAWASRDDHPVWRYWTGESRKDLDTVRGWLAPSSAPNVFDLRFLTRPQRVEIKGILESGRDDASDLAALRALRYGLTGISGPNAPRLKAWEKGKAPELTERDFDAIEDVFGLDLLLEVGHAINSASRDLLDIEKKA